MFPDPSGATTPVAPIASKPQDNEDVEELEDGMPPSRSGTESVPVSAPEPHWDPVIGAATD
jgi:hypothetical protein